MSNISRVRPDLDIARRVLPAPLLKAIHHIFNQNILNTVLVGGTALSGFYAGHRRSDDIDLFTQTKVSFDAALMAVKSLETVGAKLSNQSHSNQYYRSLCTLDHHSFTVDLVLDENLFKVGSFQKIEKISLVDLPTLFKMKAATLVSRCSEKDLYDLLWLFTHYSDESSNIEHLIQSALEIDLGANAESMLISLTGATLSQKACNFAIHEPASSAYQKILSFRKQLIREIRDFESGKKNSPLKDVIRALEKLR